MPWCICGSFCSFFAESLNNCSCLEQGWLMAPLLGGQYSCLSGAFLFLTPMVLTFQVLLGLQLASAPYAQQYVKWCWHWEQLKGRKFTIPAVNIKQLNLQHLPLEMQGQILTQLWNSLANLGTVALLQYLLPHWIVGKTEWGMYTTQCRKGNRLEVQLIKTYGR